jgi:hypothetical protein
MIVQNFPLHIFDIALMYQMLAVRAQIRVVFIAIEIIVCFMVRFLYDTYEKFNNSVDLPIVSLEDLNWIHTIMSKKLFDGCIIDKLLLLYSISS